MKLQLTKNINSNDNNKALSDSIMYLLFKDLHMNYILATIEINENYSLMEDIEQTNKIKEEIEKLQSIVYDNGRHKNQYEYFEAITKKEIEIKEIFESIGLDIPTNIMYKDFIDFYIKKDEEKTKRQNKYTRGTIADMNNEIKHKKRQLQQLQEVQKAKYSTWDFDIKLNEVITFINNNLNLEISDNEFNETLDCLLVLLEYCQIANEVCTGAKGRMHTEVKHKHDLYTKEMEINRVVAKRNEDKTEYQPRVLARYNDAEIGLTKDLIEYLKGENDIKNIRWFSLLYEKIAKELSYILEGMSTRSLRVYEYIIWENILFRLQTDGHRVNTKISPDPEISIIISEVE